MFFFLLLYRYDYTKNNIENHCVNRSYNIKLNFILFYSIHIFVIIIVIILGTNVPIIFTPLVTHSCMKSSVRSRELVFILRRNTKRKF